MCEPGQPVSLEYDAGVGRYQAKCARWLRGHYASLAPRERSAVDGALAGGESVLAILAAEGKL